MLLREIILFFVALQVSISRSQDYITEMAEPPCSTVCDEMPGCEHFLSSDCKCQYICRDESGESTDATTVSTCPNVGEACYPNAFAYGTIDNNCECSDVISCYPYCPENSTIDWDHCYSCSDCACLPIKEPCSEEPCPDFGPFCMTSRDPNTCECQTVCCDQPFCPNGFEVCDSCSNCRCKEGCPDEPCPKNADPFCNTERNPETCECDIVSCCSIQPCPNGYEVCDSCTNCRCKEGCPDEPCPDRGPFCMSSRDPETCECQTACCDQPYCPNGYEVCDSCTNCRCREDATKPPKATRRPRRKICKPVAPKKPRWPRNH